LHSWRLCPGVFQVSGELQREFGEPGPVEVHEVADMLGRGDKAAQATIQRPWRLTSDHAAD